MRNLFVGFGLSALLTTAIGAVCNVAAVLANGGKMPVIVDYCPYGFVLDSRHMCAGVSAKLPFLIDRFVYGDYIYSLGDGIIGLGQVLAVAALIILIGNLLEKYKKA